MSKVVKITSKRQQRRSSIKTLFSYGNSQEKVNLLIMRALIYYFRLNKE